MWVHSQCKDNLVQMTLDADADADVNGLMMFGVVVILVAYTCTWVNAKTAVDHWLRNFEVDSNTDSEASLDLTSYIVAHNMCLILCVKVWAWLFVALITLFILQKYVLSHLTRGSKYGTILSILFSSVATEDLFELVLTTFVITFLVTWFSVGRVLMKYKPQDTRRMQYIKSTVSNVLMFNLILVSLTMMGHLISR